MFLILDFTKSLRLAIVKKNNFIKKELKTKKNISEVLIDEIEKFLKKSKTNINKIKTIYVITGPGSFTGIRSALTFAKSLRLTMNLNIFGISKFAIINSKFNDNQSNKKKCIILHFKNSQFFIQNFEGNKTINEPRLVNFNHENFKYNIKTTYIFDNIIFQDIIEKRSFQKNKVNFHLVDYNLSEMQEIISKNIIDHVELKPLYISNYY